MTDTIPGRLSESAVKHFFQGKKQKVNKWAVFYAVFSMLQHQQQVVAAVERAKQVTMQELNAIIGVSIQSLPQ